jgi:hypothetical protein
MLNSQEKENFLPLRPVWLRLSTWMAKKNKNGRVELAAFFSVLEIWLLFSVSVFA